MFNADDRALLHNIARTQARLVRVIDGMARADMRYEMATQETLNDLQAKVQANTDVVQSAKLALEGFVSTTDELIKKLNEALARDDETAIAAAVAALDANNVTLRAAIPSTAAAVKRNT